MKSVDKKSNTCINSSNAIKVKDPPKCKICDFVRISKYKNIFAKVYVLNQSEEVFVIKKVKSTVPWTYVVSDHNEEEIGGTFFRKIIGKKQIRKSLEWEKQ